MHFFQMLRRLLHMIFITSPLSLSSLFSLSSPLLSSSPIRGLPGRFFFVLCYCRLFSLFCVTASAAAAALFLLLLPSPLVLLLLLVCCCCVAAGRRRCSCCWWVLRVLERLFLVSGRFFSLSAYFLCHPGHCGVVVRCTLRGALRAHELVITMMDG